MKNYYHSRKQTTLQAPQKQSLENSILIRSKHDLRDADKSTVLVKEDQTKPFASPIATSVLTLLANLSFDDTIHLRVRG